MKKNIFKFVLMVLLFWGGSFAGNLARASSMVQQLIPTQSYWVVETNLKQRDYSIVRFYNPENKLIYEEKLMGFYLNISRPKHIKRLNLALQKVTENAWAELKQPNLVAGLFLR